MKLTMCVHVNYESERPDQVLRLVALELQCHVGRIDTANSAVAVSESGTYGGISQQNPNASGT